MEEGRGRQPPYDSVVEGGYGDNGNGIAFGSSDDGGVVDKTGYGDERGNRHDADAGAGARGRSSSSSSDGDGDYGDVMPDANKSGASFDAAHSAALAASGGAAYTYSAADLNAVGAHNGSSNVLPPPTSSPPPSVATERQRRTWLFSAAGFNWKRCLLANLCVAAIVVAVVVPVVILTGSGSGGGDGGSGGEDGWTKKSSMSEEEAQRRYESLRVAVLQLPSVPSTTAAALDNPQSPQSRALTWLAEEDGLRLGAGGGIGGNGADPRLGPRFALSTLYFSTSGDAWTLNFGFQSDEEVCRWNRQVEDFGMEYPYKGALCFEGEEVDSLVLPINNLSGTIPPELSLLPALGVLHLYSNLLSGTFPPDLLTLSGLTIFDLHSNRLTGKIPPTIGDDLTNLEHLDLSFNEFTGEIPGSLSRLVAKTGSRLVNLDLARNRLTGIIPPLLLLVGEGTGSPLEYLSLSHNYLSGSVPPSTSFSPGQAPAPTSSFLTDLWLDGNFLTGPLPASTFLSHPYLSALGASDNRISGQIPSRGLEGAPRLRALHLGMNKLSGTIPPSVGNTTLLEVLELQRNRLVGTLPREMGKLERLVELNLSRNMLRGRLPEAFWNVTAGIGMLRLEVVRLERNRFVGVVPQSWASLTNLDTLIISNNSIGGDVSFLCGGTNTIDVFLADCFEFKSEVRCSCCTACCSDIEGPSGDTFGCFSKDNIFHGT